jgi:hypothetical protein
MSNPKLNNKNNKIKIHILFQMQIITPMKSQRNNKSLIHDAKDFNDG